MLIFVLALAATIGLTACSNGGGGSPAGGSGNGGTLSWAQSTVQANTNYMKTGDSITLTVTVKDTQGNLMNLDREFQVAPLCTGCLNPMTAKSATDFALVSKGVYTYTFTAQDTSEVSFMLIYYGGSGSPSDTVPNQPKLSLVKWEFCVEAIPDGQTFRQVVNGGVTYNAICSREDLLKLKHDNVASNTALLNQNYVLMKDVVLTSSDSVVFATSYGGDLLSPFTGVFDGNGKNISGGGNFNIAVANGATIRNLNVINKSQYLSNNIQNSSVISTSVAISDYPGNVVFGTCRSVTFSSSGALTCDLFL